MIIQGFDKFLDGGTISVRTNEGTYSFDGRINSMTLGRLFDGYPKEDNSNIIKDSLELEKQIIESLKSYKHDFYQSSIDYLINHKENEWRR